MTFPTHFQNDAMDCGPTCLLIVASHYGRVLSLPELRRRSFTTREGSSLLGLSDAAESLGFHGAGVKLTWLQLRDDTPDMERVRGAAAAISSVPENIPEGLAYDFCRKLLTLCLSKQDKA